MNIVVSPDSFKGSLHASVVADAIGEGVLRVWPDASVEKIPLADGGEGTVDAMVHATGGRIITKGVTGPLGTRVSSFFGILGDEKTAVIEMAAASGLPLVPVDQRDPLVTTTFGTGELIQAAMDAGCNRIIIGIGGSATNDGGVGMAQALGASFLDEKSNELPPGGGALHSLAHINLTRVDARIKSTEFIVACDVTNPLVGPKGASVIYAPQKGATPEDVDRLERGMIHYANQIETHIRIDVRHIPGAGAAGGLGAGLIAFLGAKIKPGIDVVLNAVRFQERIAGANLIITGEGLLDRQTVYGKTISGVAQRAKDANVPLVAIGGGVLADQVDELYARGVDAVISSTWRPMSLDEAFSKAYNGVVHAALNAVRFISVGMKI